MKGCTVQSLLLNILTDALQEWNLINFTDDTTLGIPADMLVYKTAIQTDPDRLEKWAKTTL